jgi:zinc protease
MLQSPQFPQNVLEREKARKIAALKESQTKPEYIAGKTFNKAVFGDHPYGWTPSEADLEKIQRADVEAFYKSHYVAGGAIVAIMGDVSRAEAEAIAQQLTVQLPAGNAPAAIPPVALQIQGREQRIEHPATQSHILIGAPGIARGDPDYVALYVGNYVLGGGGFVSRLMNEVREKRGLAYNVYSYFMPMKQPGAFQIGLQTKKEQTDEALQVVRSTLDNFVANGPTEAELQAAKDNIIGGFPLRIDNNKKILEYLGVIGYYDLPLTYLDDFPERVSKVTVAQVRDAIQRHLHPAEMATVIVGAPEVAGKTISR